jgi:NADH-quinone oxidoreductase subunit L
MNPNILLWPILAPIFAGALALLVPKGVKWVREALAVAASALVLYFAWNIFRAGGEGLRLFVPWTSFGIHFDLFAYHLPRFILLAAAGFEVLLALYSASFMQEKWRSNEYFAYFLFTAGLTNGAILANNFVVLLFFWEALLVTLYGMISIGNKEAVRTSTKAVIVSGIADFAMILGIVFAWKLSGTLTMSQVHLEAAGLGAAAFVLIGTGAMAKAGAMPFHTWIPDAAVDSPLPFMAFLPAALEKLLGIYLLARLSLEMFAIRMNGSMSIFLMIVGAATICFAVWMALIQKDYKKLLSFHAISQVGYMVLGIGTGTAIGIAGGVFHMLNHAMYKCTLFLTGGSVEKQAGTTDLKKLGGLFGAMPITAVCFWIAAFSISGVPPFNGFVSKEMVFHGAYETGYIIFPIAAWIGAIFTFASFLKLGHATYLGKRNPETPNQKAKDPDWAMAVPMIVIAAGCVLFGVYAKLPLKNFIQPIVQERMAEEALLHSAHAITTETLQTSETAAIIPATASHETVPTSQTSSTTLQPLAAATTTPAPEPIKHEPASPAHTPVDDLWHHNHGFALTSWIAWVSLACLVIAFLLHRYGVSRNQGKAYLASEPIHNLPVARTLYSWGEARVFDLYEWFVGGILKGLAVTVFAIIDRGIDAVYEYVMTFVGGVSIKVLRAYHNGVYANYLAWAVGGFILIVLYLTVVVK